METNASGPFNEEEKLRLRDLPIKNDPPIKDKPSIKIVVVFQITVLISLSSILGAIAYFAYPYQPPISPKLKEQAEIGLGYHDTGNPQINARILQTAKRFQQALSGSVRWLGKIADVYAAGRSHSCMTVLVVKLQTHVLPQKRREIILGYEWYHTLRELLLQSGYVGGAVAATAEPPTKSILAQFPALENELQERLRYAQQMRHKYPDCICSRGIATTPKTAFAKAKRAMIEKCAEQVISSHTLVKNFQVVRDEIIARFKDATLPPVQDKIEIKRWDGKYEVIVWYKPLVAQMSQYALHHDKLKEYLYQQPLCLLYDKENFDLEKCAIFLKARSRKMPTIFNSAIPR